METLNAAGRALRQTPRQKPQAPAVELPTPAVTFPHWVPVTPERRRALIEQLAYASAEQRNFMPGGELQDWLRAEAEVDSWLEGDHFSGD